jgi:hypothetical protein
MQLVRDRLCAFTLAWAVVLAGARWAVAQIGGAEADDDSTPPTVRLNVLPAAAPRPALKYQLLPNIRDRRPGNAAVHYSKLGLRYPGTEPEAKQFDQQWLDMPLADLPRDKVRAFLDSHRDVLDDIDLAARRETCDWELPIRERDFISLRLEEAQRVRSFAKLLRLQARLQIVEGRLDEALHTLQTGYAMGGQIAREPTLISGLVGIAICGIMSNQLEDLIQQPGAPNLYWALTELPQPLIDLRPGKETEGQMLYLSYPELADLENRDYGPEYWQRLIDRLLANTARWGDGELKESDRLLFVARAIKRYPLAKQHLIEMGRSTEEVEAMPVAKVVAIDTMRTYDEFRDEMFKWFPLPYWQARPGMEQANETLKHAPSREIMPIASLILPAVGNVMMASARSERTIAMLRVIEAVRLYGAAHDGKLPAKLTDVIEVPLPVDPLSGGPFVYRLEGDMAILEAPLPQGLVPRTFGSRFEIKFAK